MCRLVALLICGNVSLLLNVDVQLPLWWSDYIFMACLRLHNKSTDKKRLLVFKQFFNRMLCSSVLPNWRCKSYNRPSHKNNLNFNHSTFARLEFVAAAKYVFWRVLSFSLRCDIFGSMNTIEPLVHAVTGIAFSTSWCLHIGIWSRLLCVWYWQTVCSVQLLSVLLMVDIVSQQCVSTSQSLIQRETTLIVSLDLLRWSLEQLSSVSVCLLTAI